jgi:glutamyl-tRNA synthetase
MAEKNDRVYRFAPSPTGYLHVGGARTAIYNWLLAKSQSGKFLLRIEDTDSDRSTKESVRQIFSSLDWLGVNWDADVVYQSQRLKRHQEIVNELFSSGHAYPCFCTQSELARKRENAQKNKENFFYDGTCRGLTKQEIEHKKSSGLAFSIRLKVGSGGTKYTDGVHGDVSVANDEIGDFIISRSDGTPVYQLAVVVDDHDMCVTHIVRGDDHISNTPKQILIYMALNWPVPQFSHLPLILGEDKIRLSKRHGASSVEEFKEQGILTSALFNYLCLLGWAPGDDREILNKDELIASFSIERISKGNAVFDYQKLLWMNAKYIANSTNEEILALIFNYYDEQARIKIKDNRERFQVVVELLKPRAKTLIDFISNSLFYFSDPKDYEQKGVEKFFVKPEVSGHLDNLSELLSDENKYELDNLEQIIRGYAADKDLGAGKIIHPLRLALTGKTTSPGIFEIIKVLGKETVQRRIKNAIKFIAKLNI